MMRTDTGRKPRSGLKRTIALASATFLLSGAASAQTVVVEGNRRVETETIRSYVTGRGGNVEAARQDLVATGLFSSVSVSRRGGAVVVRVSENNVINRVAFEGNKRLKGEQLRPELQTQAGGSYNPATADADRQRILEIYRRSGRGLASVTPRVVDLPNGRVDVVFGVDEGDKTGVKEIRFEGNQAFSNSRLRGIMTTTEGNLLSFLKTTDIYDPDRLAADQELVRRYYLKNGYADFRVVSNDVRFDEQRGGYVIVITVDEGPQYRVGGVRVDSRIPDIETARLQRQVQTSTGSVYSAEAVEKTLTGITVEAGRRGYAFAQVRPQGNKDTANRRIDLVYVVEEGPRVYIERINVRGNTRTKDYVIRREFEVGEGDAYNRVLVDRAERRLNSLGYFKKVRVTNEPGSTPDRVVVNVDLEDQATGQFSVSGGYSTSDGFIGEVALSESNFLGNGQYVRVAGSVGQFAQGVDFSFTEPYFLGQRFSAGFDLFAKESDNTRYARYENRVTGGTLRFGFPLTDELSLGVRYSLYESDLKVPNTSKNPFNDCSIPIAGVTDVLNGQIAGTPAAGFGCQLNGEASVAVKESRGSTITSLGGYTLAYNTLENPRDPRNGFLGEVRQDIAGIGGDSQFVRTSGDARYFYEIYEDIVGTARLQGGHILGFGDRSLRIVDHYFLGPSLVRGFAPSGIGPRDISVPDTRTSAVGGTTYAGASLEVQFPIPLAPRELGIKGAVFADAGTLFGFDAGQKIGRSGKSDVRFFDVNRDGKVNAVNGVEAGCNVGSGLVVAQTECATIADDDLIRSAVGASLLWQSPLGPIRFDYAFPLSVAKNPLNGAKLDRTQAFRFSGGSRF